MPPDSKICNTIGLITRHIVIFKNDAHVFSECMCTEFSYNFVVRHCLGEKKNGYFSHPLKPHQKDKITHFSRSFLSFSEIETNFRYYKQLYNISRKHTILTTLACRPYHR